MKKLVMIGLLSLATILCAKANDPESAPADPNTQPSLKDQYDDVESDIATYDGYRMLKAYKVEDLWKAVTKTIEDKDAALAAEQQKTADLNQKIQGLNQTIANKDHAVDGMEYAGTHINVLGMGFYKPVFVAAAGIVIAGLIAIIISLLLTTRAHQQKKDEIKKLYTDLFSEFEVYKHNAIEKHIKVSRELQDYRLRVEEMTSVK